MNRSEMMRSVKGKDTAPEVAVRKWLYAHGFRYRKNVRRLPGQPDIVLRPYSTVIFVHGCFWHRHPRCKIASMPRTNSKFWWRKFNANMGRDIDHEQTLKRMGWHVEVIWECEISDAKLSDIATRLKKRRPSLPPRYDSLHDTADLMMVMEPT